MTKEERNKIKTLQLQGMGYRTIAAILNLPVNSVKSWCRRHPVRSAPEKHCHNCGAAIEQTPQKRRKKFCSDKCRYIWWSAHPEKRNTKTVYHNICFFCGGDFDSSRATGKYCSVACFANARRKEGNDDKGAI